MPLGKRVASYLQFRYLQYHRQYVQLTTCNETSVSNNSSPSQITLMHTTHYVIPFNPNSKFNVLKSCTT